MALARQGRLAAAEGEFRETIRLDGDHAGAHFNLGVSLARAGRPGAAAASFREALRIDPGYEDARRNLEILGGLTDR